MTWAKFGSRLGYQVHQVVDGGEARIVLNVLVTPSEVTENRPMLVLLWSTIFRWRIHPARSLATPSTAPARTLPASSSGGSPAPADRYRPSDQSSSGASFESLLAANEDIFQQAGLFLRHPK
jgi:hypothetical protein